MHAPFALEGALDSGSAASPVTYAAIPGSGPVIVSGGVAVPASAFAAAGQPGVFRADLTRLGVTPMDLGSYPSVGETVDGCDQLQYLKMQMWHDSTRTFLARYPNLQANGDWAFLNAASGSASGFSVQAADQARVMRWVSEEAPYVHGYWDWDWADQILGVTNISSIKGVVTVSTAAAAGVGKTNARWVGLNLLSELDAVGEYYISKSGVLSYMPSTPPASWASAPIVSVAERCYPDAHL